MEWAEFTRGLWRIRPVAVVAHVDSWQDPDDPPMTAWIWFVGRLSIDEWFAHGVSDVMDTDFVDRITETIDGEIMDVILTYGGVEWHMLEDGMATHVANVQRAMLNGMDDRLLGTLRKLGRSEILALREAEENQIDREIRK